MPSSNDISPELIRLILDYHPETGKLFWRERGADSFTGRNVDPRHLSAAWNARLAGREAMTCASSGYRIGSINKIRILAHRAAWAHYYGRHPEGVIDHINSDRLDNRISNLREATVSQNACNSNGRPYGLSKFKGVYWDAGRRKWSSSVASGAKRIFLGRFDTEIEAAKAYDTAAIALHGEFARVNGA